jgi:parallel beta-helix repeat protein
VNFPHTYHKSCQTKILPAKPSITSHKSRTLLDVVMISVPRSSVLSFTVSIAVAYLVLLVTSFDATIAQIPTTTNDGGQPGVQTMSQVNVLFVNPSVGDDSAGNGGENTPFKTITKALQAAGPNTVIMLSQGTYSAETGENFPLIFKPKVSIQGDPGTKGRGIVIQGGGNYLSRAFGSQNVTVVGANQAELTGVTVINPSPRGYGLWIEYNNFLVVENTFTGSTQDGIAVTGDSASTIRNNFFYQNGANGITISGNSQPNIQENVFQQTGFGINITHNAKPLIVGNQIQYNRTGIIVQAKARPIVRNNLIQGNKEDGLVALAQSMPNLGSASEPGGNEFRNNARYDINANASKQEFPAFGNTIARNRVVGQVDFTGNVAMQDTENQENTGKPSLSGSSKLSLSSSVSSNQNSRRLNNQLLPLQPANSPLSETAAHQKQSLFRKTEVTTSNRITGDRQQPLPQKPSDTSDTSQTNYTQLSSDTIEFAAPQANNQVTSAPVQRARNQTRTLPILEPDPRGEAAFAPVPSSNMPFRNNGNIEQMPSPQSLSAAASQINLRYRVVVEIKNGRDQDLVKFLTPGAFRTVWRGREVMQAGVFSSRYNADNVVKIFNNNGLTAVVEPIN